MRLPVRGFDRCIGNRISAMDHHSVAHIDTYVGSTAGVIGSLEENQVARFSRAAGDNIAYVHQTICSQTTNAPSIAAVIDDPGYETRAVKGSGRATTAPHIRICMMFLYRTSVFNYDVPLLESVQNLMFLYRIIVSSPMFLYDRGSSTLMCRCWSDTDIWFVI